MSEHSAEKDASGGSDEWVTPREIVDALWFDHIWPRATGKAPTVTAPDLPTHTLSEYGTTTCPVERVRAEVDDGTCSACGYVFPSDKGGA